MKIVDCFTFFNELDLLEFRLKLLAPYVEQFIIAESDLTHSGSSKPYHFELNRQRFKPWLHKIEYIKVHQTATGMNFTNSANTYTPDSDAWKLENEQRNALGAATKFIGDNDLVLIGDLDEMPDPAIFNGRLPNDLPMSLSQLFHYYFMNCQHTGQDRWWNGTIICPGKFFKSTTPQALRDKRNEWAILKKAGWHFSYLGGLEKIKYKIKSFAHTEFNKEDFLDDRNILAAISRGEDIFKRPGVTYKFVSLYYYPSRVRKLMEQYPGFIHREGMDKVGQKIYYSFRNLFVK